MVGTWMLRGNGYGDLDDIMVGQWLAHGCTAGMDMV